MKQDLKYYCLAGLLSTSLALNGCMKEPNIFKGDEDNTEIKKEDFFDFSTVGDKQLSIEYGIKGVTTFQLYDEYPMELRGNTWEFKAIDPIYAGATDENGKFVSSVALPSYLKKLWIVTNNLLVASPIEVELTAGGINFNYQEYKKAVLGGRSRAIESGITYPDGYDKLGGWDKTGIPDYLLKEKEDLPSAFAKRCANFAKSVQTDMTPVLTKFPDLLATGTNDMVLTQSTALVATYFESSSGWNNMVAYYTYKEGESVDLATIKKTLLFPLYSSIAPKSLIGEQVLMKYWNEETHQYETTFPAGTRIGWVLLGMGWSNQKATVRYSNPAYNDDKKQHSILLSDPELPNYFFMAMEDNVDGRFNDAQFAITASVLHSVAPPPTIPDEVNKGEVSYVVKGSLAFEDNWPKTGDYDMNDVVVEFSSTMVKEESSNKLVRTTTTFKAVNNGATYSNGFGFELDKLTSNRISTVSVSMDAQIIGEAFEEGTKKPTLILFKNTKDVLNKPITVVITYDKYTNGGVYEKDALPPYNPFIFVNKREHELHLPGYMPTNKADDTLRGTENDLRVDSEGKEMYYISKDNMPFALYISGRSFEWPEEGQNIKNKYPNFENWKNSLGASNGDWYLNEGN